MSNPQGIYSTKSSTLPEGSVNRVLPARRSRRPKSRTYQCASLHRDLQLSGGTSATPVTFITPMRNLDRKSVNEIFSGTSKVCSCCSAWCGEESLPGLVFQLGRSSLQPLLLRRRHEPSASSSSPGSRRRSVTGVTLSGIPPALVTLDPVAVVPDVPTRPSLRALSGEGREHPGRSMPSLLLAAACWLCLPPVGGVFTTIFTTVLAATPIFPTR